MKFILTCAMSLVLLAASAITESTVIAQEDTEPKPFTDLDYKGDGTDEASSELVADFIAAVRASEFFDVATALKPEVVADALSDLKESDKADVKLQKESFLNRLADDGMQFTVGSCVWSLDYDSVGVTRHVSRRAIFLRTHVSNRDENGRTIRKTYKYEVKASDLKQLNFEILENVTVRHPLRRVLATHEVNNMSLTDVIADLCIEGGVGFSIRADVADSLHVSQRLHNRTIYECLCMAANTSGWDVEIDAGEDSDSYAEDAPIYFSDVFEAYVSRDTINVVDNLENPIESHLGALQYLVKQAIASMNSENLVVIVTANS
ncbi:hypothetical protein OAU50_05375 [Planctomycetota bacterium]|nr:hypothetical protein [Planctomycetota bacterium]